MAVVVGGWHPERNHGLSEPCLSKLQESRKLMLFDVLTMMEAGGGGGGQCRRAPAQPRMDLGTLWLATCVGGPTRCKCMCERAHQ